MHVKFIIKNFLSLWWDEGNFHVFKIQLNPSKLDSLYTRIPAILNCGLWSQIYLFLNKYPLWTGTSSLNWNLLFELEPPLWTGASSLNWNLLFELEPPLWTGTSSLNWNLLFELESPLWTGTSPLNWNLL